MQTIDDLFPHSVREFYAKAPLFEVICQLQFPRLLTIESRVPAEFHEDIRADFPMLESGNPFPQLPGIPAEALRLMGPQVGGTTYRFFTEDRKSNVSLSPESLSFATNAYSYWNKFREQLAGPLSSLKKHYNPSFLTRIGLRYQNIIDREALGLTDRPWSKLIKPEILGEFPFPNFEENVLGVARQVILNLPDGSGSVLFNHGYVNVAGKSGISYMIDFDFFKNDKVEISNAESTLDHFHKFAGRAFRLCIQDELREALGPMPSDELGGGPASVVQVL